MPILTGKQERTSCFQKGAESFVADDFPHSDESRSLRAPAAGAGTRQDLVRPAAPGIELQITAFVNVIGRLSKF